MKTNRNTDLAKIHLAKKDLQIDDDQYRDILWTLRRVRSARELDAHGRAKVLQYFRQLGWKSKPPKNRGRKPSTLEREPYLQKIEALLADMGLSWTYAESIAWRVTGGKGQQPTSEQPGVEKLEWVKEQRHFRAIVTALTREQQKRQGVEQITELLAELGQDESSLDEHLTGCYRNGKWKRSLTAIKCIIPHLHAQRLAMEDSEQ